METLTRRSLFAQAAVCGIGVNAMAKEKPKDPWTPDKLLAPAELARIMEANGPQPTVISVAFPVLYRRRHVARALQAGPTSKPEGLATLHEAAAKLPKDTQIVIYCGCCPMADCPNIRPAYSALQEAQFRNVRVLNLPNNFHADWAEKGYPVEPLVG